MTLKSLEVKVAKWYLVLLPVRIITPLMFLQSIAGPLFDYIDSVIMLWGLYLWVKNGGRLSIPNHNKSLYSTIKGSICYLNISSVIMAVVMYATYGNYRGDSPFTAIIPMMLFYFQYLLMFTYNIRVFQILDYSTITGCIKKSTRFLLVIAYFQVLAMVGGLMPVYTLFANFIGGFSPVLPKLCLTGLEGAAAGSLMGVFVFPFLFARIMHGDNKASRELLLWMLPLYFTHSSTGYILFAVDFLMFVFLMVKNGLSGGRVFKQMLGLGLLALIGYSALSYTGVIDADVIADINYLLFEKVSDGDNGSTVSRSIPFYVNWGAFTEMPILGVGNGLQGYFFYKYFPMEALYVPGSDVGEFYQVAQTKIGNGGCFWPGYLSGYGIMGLIVLLIVIMKLNKTRKSRAQNLGLFNEMFLMGSLCFIPLGMQGEVYCMYFAWFVISIPFMYFNVSEINCIHHTK